MPATLALPMPTACRSLAAMLLLGCAGWVQAATPVRVEVERDGDRFAVRAQAELSADARTAWDTLTDYEALPQFVPGITRTRVLAREGRGGDERLTVEYSGRFRLLFLSQPTQLWLDVRHRPLTEVLAQSSRSHVPARGEPAATLREFRGRYLLAVLGGGGAGRPRLRLDYDAQFELAEPLPPVIGALFGTAALRQAMREQFAAMVAEIERRAQSRPSIERGQESAPRPEGS